MPVVTEFFLFTPFFVILLARWRRGDPKELLGLWAQLMACGTALMDFRRESEDAGEDSEEPQEHPLRDKVRHCTAPGRGGAAGLTVCRAYRPKPAAPSA